MWRSEIWDSPEEQDEWYNANPLYDEWVDRVKQEPWFVALQDLVKWSGTWRGTKEELVEELRLRVDREVWESEDFPSDAQTLIEYFEVVYFSRSGLNLEIFDYREFKKGDLEECEIEGWGPKAPILVEQDQAGRRPDYSHAMYKLLQYESPLPLAVLLFTDRFPFTKRNWVWTGSTRSLAEQLCGATLKLHNLYTQLDRFEDSKRTHFLDHADWELLGDLLEPEDYRALCKRLRTCAHIVSEVSIEMSWRRRTPYGSGREDKATKLYWTIRAPRWLH